MPDTTLYASDYIGWAIWALGWVFEIISDNQKKAFLADPHNKGKFINVGKLLLVLSFLCV